MRNNEEWKILYKNPGIMADIDLKHVERMNEGRATKKIYQEEED